MTIGAWSGWRIWLAFALLSFVAVASGTTALYLTNAPTGLLPLNGIAWIAGAILSLGLMMLAGRTILILPVTIAALSAVFLFPGIDGVHRWIALGPLQINSAALLLPMTIVAIAHIGIRNRLSCIASLLILLLLNIQPDASQITAFALAIWIILLRTAMTAGSQLLGSLLLAIAVGLAWLRPDRLQPVPEAEGIVALAWQASPIVAGIGVAVLGAVALLPLLKTDSEPPTGAAPALSGYFIAASLCTLVGHYPVPLIGLGMSFVTGYWLGIGLLCRTQHAASASAETDAAQSVRGDP